MEQRTSMNSIHLPMIIPDTIVQLQINSNRAKEEAANRQVSKPETTKPEPTKSQATEPVGATNKIKMAVAIQNPPLSIQPATSTSFQRTLESVSGIYLK